MLREGRALRLRSIGQWLDGRHPDPLSEVSHGWSLGQPFRSCAHGLQTHPSRSPRVYRHDCQGISGILYNEVERLNLILWPVSIPKRTENKITIARAMDRCRIATKASPPKACRNLASGAATPGATGSPSSGPGRGESPEARSLSPTDR